MELLTSHKRKTEKKQGSVYVRARERVCVCVNPGMSIMHSVCQTQCRSAHIVRSSLWSSLRWWTGLIKQRTSFWHMPPATATQRCRQCAQKPNIDSTDNDRTSTTTSTSTSNSSWTGDRRQSTRQRIPTAT